MRDMESTQLHNNLTNKRNVTRHAGCGGVVLKQFYFMKEGTKRNGFAVMNRNQNFYYSVHYFVTVIDFSANFLLACRQHTHRVVRPRKNRWHTKPT